MPELHELLERRATRHKPAPDLFDRVLDRRRRRDRNRRLVAGFVALALVGAGVLLLVRAWNSTAPIPADQPPKPAPAALGSLAYGLDGDIYVAEWDGSNAVAIADGRPPNECGAQDGFSTGEYWAEASIWSPDGRYLAYRRANCEVPGDFRWHVVISDPQGNVLAEFPGDGWNISWSPDSTRVAVWVDLDETIGVFGVDGVRQELLTARSSGGDFDPVWSPDGESLLVDDLVVPIDRSAPYRLPFLQAGAYSPDGSRVAYSTRKSLVIAEADGSNPQVVSDEPAWNPVWSPAGDRIAFGDGPLRLLEVATGTVTLLADADRSENLEVIDFSPEGDRILYSRIEVIYDDPSDPTAYRPVGQISLWSVNSDGTDRRRLVRGLPIDFGADWLSP